MALDKFLKATVILSAYDDMTRKVKAATDKSITVLSGFQKKADALSKSAFSVGTQGAMMAAGGAAVLYKPIQAFADMEDASTSLKTSMMKDGGVVSQYFERINQIAIELGNRLPGTTADFQNMMSTLIKQGVSEETIIKGVGKSAAYLAVALKLPYEEGAKMAAKLKEATGVTNEDFLNFMDTIARTSNLGVQADEMQYAFSRSAGALKLMGIQGLEASKSISAVYATLIRTGASGETVGTGMQAILNTFMNVDKMKVFNAEAAKLGVQMEFVDKKTGQFKGVENMIAQFDKLRQFNPQQRASLVQALLGPGQDASFMNTLIDKGIAGYNDMIASMNSQATLEQKVEAQLSTLKQLWEAATGTFTNTLAAFGETIAPQLKSLTLWFGKLSESLSGFIKNHPGFAKILGLGIMGFTAIAGTIGAVGFAVAGAAKAFSFGFGGLRLIMQGGAWAAKSISWLSFLMKYQFVNSVLPALSKIGTAFKALWAIMAANPWILIAAAAIAAIILIYKNWDKIVAFFKMIWEKIKLFAHQAWEWLKKMFLNYTPQGLIIKHWDSISGWFSDLWDKVKKFTNKAWEWLKKMFLNYTPHGLIIKHWDSITGWFSKLWDKVKNVFQGFVNWLKGLGSIFVKAGANIMTSIWEGIKSMASKPVQAVQDVVKKIREFLPFSPAKRGPLMDLHRVKIVETIAQAVKPAPLVKAMQVTTAAAMLAVTPVIAKPIEPLKVNSTINSQSGVGSNSVSVVYNPSITIASGSNQDKQAFTDLLKQHKDEIARMVEDVNIRNSRKKY